MRNEGDIGLVLKRFSYNGETWNDLIMIWEDADNICENPIPIIEMETYRIHLLMKWNLVNDKICAINAGTNNETRRIFYLCSNDDGLSWTKSKEITFSVKTLA